MALIHKGKNIGIAVLILVGTFFPYRIFAATVTSTIKGNTTLYTYTTECDVSKQVLKGKIGVAVPTGVTNFSQTYVYFHGTNQPSVNTMCGNSNYNLCAQASASPGGVGAPIIFPETKNDGTWAQVFSATDMQCFLDEANRNLLTKNINLSTNYVVSGHSGGTIFVKRFFEAGFSAQSTLIFDGCYTPRDQANESACKTIAGQTNNPFHIYYRSGETKDQSIIDYESVANKSHMHLFELAPSVSHLAVPGVCFMDHIKNDSCGGKAVKYNNVEFSSACRVDEDCAASGIVCRYNICVEEIATSVPPVGSTPPASLPQGTAGCREGQDCVSLVNPLGEITDVKEIIGNTISIVMGIVGSITFVVFLYGGVLWLTSAGNSEKIQKGLQAMLWAGIGIIVIFSSYAIITLILNTLQATP